MNAPTGAPALAQSQDAVVEIDGGDLPAFCPNPKMPLWSSHPRVYLELAEKGEASCGYCGTRYRLKPGTLRAGHH